MSAGVSPIRGIVGPVFSGFGFKNWFLYLTPDAVLAVPLGAWLTVKAGLWAGLGSASGMNDVYAQVKPPFADVIEDFGDPRWRRYLRGSLERIEVRRARLSANELRIQVRTKRADLYGLANRSATDSVRRLLLENYPDVYSEVGFPKALDVT